jgi:hypothetical protein
VEQLQELLDWYLAPWRRIGRWGFNTALTVASLPGLVMMFIGFGDMASSVFGGLGQMQDMMNSGDPTQMLNGLQGMMGGTAGHHHFDWSGFINGLCFVALIPFCRMRLRDMGWFGWPEVVWTVLLNASVVAGLVEAVTGWNVLPWGWVFGALNLFGYVWLAFAKGKARERHLEVPHDAF